MIQNPHLGPDHHHKLTHFSTDRPSHNIKIQRNWQITFVVILQTEKPVGDEVTASTLIVCPVSGKEAL